MRTRKSHALLSELAQERSGKPRHLRQQGASLVEILIAMLLSIVVCLTSVLLLGNALGDNTRLVHYTLLSNELRKSMQMMSRDVRRAGYTAGAQWCLANTLCQPGTSIALPETLGILDPLPLLEHIALPAGIQISESGDCFTFELDRDQDATIDSGDYGGYRLGESDGVGVLSTWVGAGSPDCGLDSDSWAPVTNPQMIDISGFTVDDSESFEKVVSTDLLGNTTTQGIRRIRFELTGRLVRQTGVNETIETTIDIRNDMLM